MAPRFFFSLFILLLSCSQISASETSLDLGAYADNLAERFSAPSDYGSEVSAIQGRARIRLGLFLSKTWKLETSFALNVPYRTSYDGSTKIFIQHLELDLSVPIASWLALRLGPTLYTSIFWGTGESVQLNNGPPPNTATFYTPDAILLTFATMAHAGFQIKFTNSMSLLLDGYVLSLLDANRRNYHASASLGWVL